MKPDHPQYFPGQEATAENSQAHLEASKIETRQILDAAPVGIAVTDARRHFVSVNPAMCALTGYAAAELTGQSSRLLYLTDEEFTRVGAEKPGQFQPSGQCTVEARLVHKNGRPLDVEIAIAPLSPERPSGLMTLVIQDITQRKRAETQLRLRSAALDAAANAIMITRTDGAIEWANPAFVAMTGYTVDEVTGRNPRDLVRSEQQEQQLYTELWQTICAGQVWQGELINRRKDGSLYHEFQTITPVPDENGKISHFVAVKQDISRRVANEMELREYREHLEELVAERTVSLQAARLNAERLAQVKSEFLANMSHEIRTPLNAVLGLAQIGMRTNAGRKCGESFARILQSGELLLGIVNDILDLSKMEAGKLTIENLPVSLNRLVSRAIDLTADQARSKGIDLSFRCGPDMPAACLGDELRLLQILINLLANAVKFTERGSVTLDICRIGSQLVFRITDTGIGMSSEQVSHLFHAFEQADNSTTRRFGGTGLGLVICKRLLDLMHGSIRVDSWPGRGSVFEIHLPYIEASEPSLAPGIVQPAEQRLKGLRILAAEDNEINRMVLEELLIEEGVELTFAENGLEAVEQVAEHGGDAWDIVLMDIMMPLMDGHEASSILRDLAPRLPVIGLTAHALEDERERCEASGMVAHVAKPFKLDVLVATIQRHAKQRER